MMNTWALLLAAGQGLRLQAATQGIAKQFLSYKDLPLYWHSVQKFTLCARIRGLVLVLPEANFEEELEKALALSYNEGHRLPLRFAKGGKLRQNSVQSGLLALPDDCDSVLIHDAARPFFTTKLCQKLLDALENSTDIKGFIPSLPLIDTIKEHKEGQVCKTLSREGLVRVQTPQIFCRQCLEKAHTFLQAQGFEVTDDAAALEAIGQAVGLIDGEEQNCKITNESDLTLLSPQKNRLPLVAFGYDVHRFAAKDESEKNMQKARPLRLGSVPIPGGAHVIAHSDGDVLLHALTDALLSLMCAGDIGTLFPDSDPAYDNISSSLLLDQVMTMLHTRGLKLCHVDLTIITQKPKIAPHRKAIQKACAHLLQLSEHCVNVKATTEEKLGFTGEGKGIKAVALVTALESEA